MKMKKKFATVFSFILFLSMLAACGEDKKQAQKEVKLWKIGDLIKSDNFEVKISSVNTRASIGGEWFNEKAPEGAIFLTVNFSYKNIAKEPVSPSNVPNINLVDPNGTKYEEASGATAFYHTEIKIDKKIFSNINPGITQRDAVVFEIARENWNTKGWKLLLTEGRHSETVEIK
jgi:hypothetical protein